MELTTRCPQCQTAFPVSLEQLQLRKGYIRCVQCAHIFDGFDAVVPTAAGPEHTIAPERETAPRNDAPAAGTDESSYSHRFIIPPDDSLRDVGPTPARPFSIGGDHAPVAAREPQMPAVLRGRHDMRPSAGDPSFTITDRRTATTSRSEPVFGLRGAADVNNDEARIEDPAPIEETGDAPEADDFLFVEPRANRRSQRHIADQFDGGRSQKTWMTPVWGVLTAIGLIVLLLQGVYVYRSQLANAFPGLRPSLEAACQKAGCAVPYERQIHAITITGSALRASAATEDGVSQLTLEATLRNTHERPQEWPTLVLDLKDASGTVVVRRNLSPEAWVPGDLRSGPFPAGREITVQVPVSVRGVQANGYQLDKFFP